MNNVFVAIITVNVLHCQLGLHFVLIQICQWCGVKNVHAIIYSQLLALMRSNEYAHHRPSKRCNSDCYQARNCE